MNRFGVLWRYSAASLTFATGSIGIASYFDEGTRRSVQFWTKVTPVYLHYRFYQILNRDLGILPDQQAWNIYKQLDQRWTNHVRDTTYEMRGFYMKNAQLMSTQDDFVPEAYMSWVKKTQDNVPSEFESPNEVRAYVSKVLQDELGLKFDEVFSEWDDKPLGIASIGQVHKATLRENGQTVAVKIQLPGIEERFRADIRTLKSFCKLAFPQHVTAFDEIEKQFCTEFDYKLEALNLQEVRRAVMPTWQSRVVIPEPKLSLCSKHILVMEFLQGVKLVDGIREQYKRIAKKMGVSVETLEAIQKAQITSKTLDEARWERTSMERSAWLYDTFLTLNTLRVIYNYSIFRLVTGPFEYHKTELPIDLADTITILSRVHGYELFQCGMFNGDCHPGNILLLSDGRLGLIDYGQVKRMTMQERINYARLIKAHSMMDYQEVVRLHFDVLETRTKDRKEDIGYLFSAFYNDRNSPDVCGNLNVKSFIDWLEANDKMVHLPEAYLMAGRLSLLLRGVGNAFGLQLRMSKLWEYEADTFLEEHGHKDKFPVLERNIHPLCGNSNIDNNTMVITSEVNASGTFPDKNDMKLIKRHERTTKQGDVTINTTLSAAMEGPTPVAGADVESNQACPMSGKKGGKCPWGFGNVNTNTT